MSQAFSGISFIKILRTYIGGCLHSPKGSLFGIRRGLEPLSHTMVSITPVVYYKAVARKSSTV